MKVIIDGIEYIPVNETTTNYMDIARGLLMECMGFCNIDETLEYLNDESIHVLVNDWGRGIPLRDMVDIIAKESGLKNCKDC